MSRPASMPVHPPPQPVDSGHHGAVHSARHPVQDRGMKGERGPDAAGRTTRCSSRWRLPLAWQQSRPVPVNPTLSQRISLCPGKSHLVAANPACPTLSQRIPLHPGESRFVPAHPTLSQRIPPPAHPTLSQRISLRPGESHFVPANLTLSRRIPPCPSESRLSHFIPANPASSRRIPLCAGESHFNPANPSSSHRHRRAGTPGRARMAAQACLDAAQAWA